MSSTCKPGVGRLK